MSEELIIFRDLTDEELANLTDEEIFDIHESYVENGVPVRATIKGLLSELEIKYDDLSEFILSLEVGRCNTANRTKDQIYISRKNSPIKDNIVINLNKNSDVPDVTIQVEISDEFMHEEAYNSDGILLYQA